MSVVRREDQGVLKLNAFGTDVMVKLYPPCSSILRDARELTRKRYLNTLTQLAHSHLSPTPPSFSLSLSFPLFLSLFLSLSPSLPHSLSLSPSLSLLLADSLCSAF